MKEDQRTELTKRLLKEGLFRLLEYKQLDEIGVSELCKEAGINRSTFYRHYDYPKGILNEIRRNIFEDVRKFATNIKQDEDLLQWLEITCEYFYKNSDVLKVLFNTRSDEDFVSLLNEQCKDLIPKLRQKGVIDGADDDDIRLGTYYYAGGIYYVLRQWLSEPITKTPAEVAQLIFHFLVGNR